PVLCHRDFHDKQILIDGDRGTLIDMDLAAAGHPALDVGNILAHLRLRELKGAELRWQEVASPIAVHATRDRGIEDSLPIWTASTLLRLALIYARRFRRPGLIEALLDSTEAALDRSGEWEGLLS
ncbi:MAG: phosphotransferase, partial [Planctomycetota bacterium]